MKVPNRVPASNLLRMPEPCSHLVPTEHGVLAEEILQKHLRTLKEKAEEHSSFIQEFKKGQEEKLDFPEIKDSGMRDGGRTDDRFLMAQASEHELAKATYAIRRIENDLRGPRRNRSLLPFGKCAKPDCDQWIEEGRLEALPDEPVCLSHCGCVSGGKAHRN